MQEGLVANNPASHSIILQEGLKTVANNPPQIIPSIMQEGLVANNLPQVIQSFFRVN